MMYCGDHLALSDGSNVRTLEGVSEPANGLGPHGGRESSPSHTVYGAGSNPGFAITASAARRAASALWKASSRSYWLEAILYCMMVPLTAARPTSVMTTSRISATASATPRCWLGRAVRVV